VVCVDVGSYVDDSREDTGNASEEIVESAEPMVDVIAEVIRDEDTSGRGSGCVRVVVELS
jgi:hypothetical protein